MKGKQWCLVLKPPVHIQVIKFSMPLLLLGPALQICSGLSGARPHLHRLCLPEVSSRSQSEHGSNSLPPRLMLISYSVISPFYTHLVVAMQVIY
jgi:hypothetical protein